MNLISTSKGDSSVIYNTKGYLYPTQQKFYGSGGNVDWTRAGWDKNTVSAKLKTTSLMLQEVIFPLILLSSRILRTFQNH